MVKQLHVMYTHSQCLKGKERKGKARPAFPQTLSFLPPILATSHPKCLPLQAHTSMPKSYRMDFSRSLATRFDSFIPFILQESAEDAAKQDMTGIGSGDRKREPPPMARISEEPSNLGSARGSLESAAEKQPSLGSVPELSRAPQASAASVNPETVHSLLGTSATAAAASATAPEKQRPRGLGNSQGLPTKKRPSSAKATPRNVRSKEDKSAKVGNTSLPKQAQSV